MLLTIETKLAIPCMLPVSRLFPIPLAEPYLGPFQWSMMKLHLKELNNIIIKKSKKKQKLNFYLNLGTNSSRLLPLLFHLIRTFINLCNHFLFFLELTKNIVLVKYWSWRKSQFTIVFQSEVSVDYFWYNHCFQQS